MSLKIMDIICQKWAFRYQWVWSLGSGLNGFVFFSKLGFGFIRFHLKSSGSRVFGYPTQHYLQLNDAPMMTVCRKLTTLLFEMSLLCSLTGASLIANHQHRSTHFLIQFQKRLLENYYCLENSHIKPLSFNTAHTPQQMSKTIWGSQ